MTDTPHYINHRKRLRERFQRTGAEGMHDYELLELLLTFSIPRRDVKPVAKKLINTFGSLPGVLDADQSELEKLSGVGSMSASLIRLVKELYTTYLSERMKEADILSSPERLLNSQELNLAACLMRLSWLYTLM
jgi:DNA repair protein RadC